MTFKLNRDNVAGIATRYELESPRYESRKSMRFLLLLINRQDRLLVPPNLPCNGDGGRGGEEGKATGVSS